MEQKKAHKLIIMKKTFLVFILLITLGLLLVQFRLMAVWWSRSVSTKPSKD